MNPALTLSPWVLLAASVPVLLTDRDCVGVTVADQVKFDVDTPGKVLTVYYKSSYTTAAQLRAAMNNAATAVDKDDADRKSTRLNSSH